MSSHKESGHAKNVSLFQTLVSLCIGYGGAYNPSGAAIALSALQVLYAAALASIDAVTAALRDYKNATNQREVLFDSLRELSTRVVNALSSSQVSQQTMDDARAILRKMRGKRAGGKKEAGSGGEQEGELPSGKGSRRNSVSQQSFDALTGHFKSLLALVAAEPLYAPNEADLTVAALQAFKLSLEAANALVIDTKRTLGNARIARDHTLYDETTGMLAIAALVKDYVKSVFGAGSAEYRQISGLQFNPL